jgi:hypothetical protein
MTFPSAEEDINQRRLDGMHVSMPDCPKIKKKLLI